MGKIKRILMLFVAIIFFAAAAYLIWQWRKAATSGPSSSSNNSWGQNLNTSDTSFKPSGEALNGNLDNIKEPADWKIYKNADLGFSLNVPQMVLGIDRCKSTKFEAPIVVLEDLQTDSVFIVPEYYYDRYAPKATQDSDVEQITFEEDDPANTGDPNLSDSDGDGQMDCRKKIYSLALVKLEIIGSYERSSKIPMLGNPYAGVALRTGLVRDTEQLNDFIASSIGAGCVLASKEAWTNQEGDYKLTVKKSGKKDNKGKELPCNTDKVTDIIYNPSKNQVAYFYLPADAPRLLSGESESFDREMVASFRFN